MLLMTPALARSQVIGNYTANKITGGTKPTTCSPGPPADVWIDTVSNPPVLNICGPGGVWIVPSMSGPCSTANNCYNVTVATPGLDTCAKIQTAIDYFATKNTGGSIVATSLSPVCINKIAFTATPTTSGGAKGVVVFLSSGLSYIGGGSGDFISCITTTDGAIASTCRYSGFIGIQNWATTIETNASNATVMDNVIHNKWTTHFILENVAIRTNTKATHGWFSEQSMDDTAYNIVCAGNVTSYTAGQRAAYFLGQGYAHIIKAFCSGSENAILIDTTNQTIPAEVRSALGYIATDGQDVHWNYWANLQGALSFKDGIKVAASATNGYKYWQNESSMWFAYGNGLAGANDANENGIHFYVPSPSSTEQISKSTWTGLFASSNQMCGVVLEGQVARNSFNWIETELNAASGSAGDTGCYGLWLKNGTGGVGPVENTINGRLDISTTRTANRAFVIDSNAARNNGTLGFSSNPFGNSTIPYTFSNITNSFNTITELGAGFLGTMDYSSASILKMPVSAGAAPTANGQLAYDSTQTATMLGGAGTVTGAAPRVLYSVAGGTDATTGLVAATITTNETAFTNSYNIPANYLIDGKKLRVTCSFAYTATATVPTFDLRLRLGGVGGTLVFDGGAPTPTATAGKEFTMVWTISGTAAPGASVATYTTGQVGYVQVAVQPVGSNGTAQPVNVATNAQQAITPTIQFGSNAAGNVVKMYSMVVEELN